MAVTNNLAVTHLMTGRLDDAEMVAHFLHRDGTVIELQVVRSRAGHPLPPYILPIGCRKRLWPYQKVHDWLAGFLVTGDGSGVSNAGHGGTSRQGRSHRKSDFT